MTATAAETIFGARLKELRDPQIEDMRQVYRSMGERYISFVKEKGRNAAFANRYILSGRQFVIEKLPTPQEASQGKVAAYSINEKLVGDAAKEQVDAAHATFLAKVDEKFRGMDLEKMEGHLHLSGGAIQARILVTLKSGAHFVLQTQIVWKYNQQGTHFAQFPATFHDVYLADGSKLKGPSEAKVKKALVGA